MAEIDVGKVLAKYGGDVTRAGVNTSNFKQTEQAVPKTSFFGNVAKSIPSLAGQAAGYVANSFIKPISDTAKAINQGLPFVGEMAQRQNDANKQLAVLDSASESYTKLYHAGKMDAARYKKLQDSVLKQRRGITNDLTGAAKNYITPGDTAKALVETAAIPFNLGAGGAVKQLAGLAAKQSLGTVGTVDTIDRTITDAQKGDYLGAAGNAALLGTAAIGGPASALVKGTGRFGKAIKESATGITNLANDVPVKDAPSLLAGVEKIGAQFGKDSKEYKKAQATLKQIQDYNLQEAHGNLPDATAKYLSAFANGADKLTTAQHLEQFQTFAKAQAKVIKAAKEGILLKGADRLATTADNVSVGRFDQSAKKALVEDLATASSPAERIARIDDAVLSGQIPNNQLLIDDLKRAALGEDFKSAINKDVIGTRALKTVDGKTLKLPKGYFPIIRQSGGVVRKAGDVVDLATPKAPGFLKPGADLLRKAGFGIDDYRPSTFQRINTSIQTKLNNLQVDLPSMGLSDGANQGKSMIDRLNAYAESKHIGDLRQLRVDEITSVLGAKTAADARAIKTAIKDAYLELPLADRGIADRIQDVNIKYNPIAAGYARVQGNLRYRLNPAFKAQQGIEAESFGQALAGGKPVTLPGVNQVREAFGGNNYQSTINKLNDSGIFAGNGLGAEAADATGLGSKITQELTRDEQKAIASTVEALAKKSGQSVDSLLQDPRLQEELRTIVQYPSRGVLSSNIAKALNLAFFPARYNVKVTALAAKTLAKMDPVTQVGVIASLHEFNKWLHTDQGINWASDNSEILGLFTYFTPVNSINSIYKLLPGGEKGSLRDAGLIGGLPFGVISLMLQDMGVTPSSQPPYLDPKTGEVVPDKIPTTLKAQAQTALRDLLQSTFTFPGRQAGLGSKGQLTDVLTGNALKVGAGESRPRDAKLTPQQENIQRVLQTPKPKKTTESTPSRPSVIALKGISAPAITPIYKSGSTKKAKNRALRPGQL